MKRSRAAGIEKLSERFFNNGANIQAKQITILHNISISLEHFPDDWKYTKLKLLYKSVKS